LLACFVLRGNGGCSSLLLDEFALLLPEYSLELAEFPASAIIVFFRSLSVCASWTSEEPSSLLEDGWNESSSDGMAVDVCGNKRDEWGNVW
jgi:hypothetical protein